MTRSIKASAAEVPIVGAIAPLVGGCTIWISDIWGVLHNGAAAFPAAVDACRRFRAGGGLVVLLSNAPRPAAAVAQQLDGFGVPRDAYDAIVSSGDLTRRMLTSGATTSVFHIGPDRDKVVFDGLGVTFADAESAARVVCTGLFDDETETAETYRPLLTRLRARGVPMICGNPDIKVERGHRLIYCAGAVAELYAKLGGDVAYAGKPYLPAYELVLETAASLKGGPVTKTEVLAIGDGLNTDIKGAGVAGLRSVFIASALHVDGPLDRACVARLFSGHPAPPIAAMPALVW